MQNLIQYAFTLAAHTLRYQWGGDDPLGGFDCSGFVTELLKSCGEISHSSPKFSAQQLYSIYEMTAPKVAGPGSLCFFGKDLQHITHVGFAISDKIMIECGGGDSTTTTMERAVEQNAFVRMRPIHYRHDFLICLKPSYSQIEDSKG